jgi:hypothetical protein
MNLKQAREQGKLEQFIKEYDAKHPPADKKRLAKLLKSVVLGTAKPKRETSRKGSRGS